MANSIERSVRRALEKGHARDPGFRLKVYEAAERAINRSEADGKLTVAEGDARRRDLIAAVEAIEADYPPLADTDDEDGATAIGEPVHPPASMAYSGGQAPSGAAGTSEVDARSGTGVGKVVAKPISAEQTHGNTKPGLGDDASRDDPSSTERELWSPGGRRAASSQRRRRAVAIVIVLLVLFLLAVAAYLVAPFFSNSTETAGRVDPIAETIQSSGPAGGDDTGWITAFSGTELSALGEPSQAGSEVVTGASGRSAVRIRPVEAGSAATITLSAETLSSLSPGTVRGELTVGSPDGERREMAVECVVAGESVCGRQRFSTTLALETFVFDMSLPVDLDTTGELVIDPQIGAGAGDVDIYGFRMRDS